jgi:hypothetical protein
VYFRRTPLGSKWWRGVKEWPLPSATYALHDWHPDYLADYWQLIKSASSEWVSSVKLGREAREAAEAAAREGRDADAAGMAILAPYVDARTRDREAWFWSGAITCVTDEIEFIIGVLDVWHQTEPQRPHAIGEQKPLESVYEIGVNCVVPNVAASFVRDALQRLFATGATHVYVFTGENNEKAQAMAERVGFRRQPELGTTEHQWWEARINRVEGDGSDLVIDGRQIRGEHLQGAVYVVTPDTFEYRGLGPPDTFCSNWSETFEFMVASGGSNPKTWKRIEPLGDYWFADASAEDLEAPSTDPWKRAEDRPHVYVGCDWFAVDRAGRIGLTRGPYGYGSLPWPSNATPVEVIDGPHGFEIKSAISFRHVGARANVCPRAMCRLRRSTIRI